METDQKDYAFRNEISLSIGDSNSGAESTAASTPSTASPSFEPKPSPRQIASDDSKLLSGDKSSYEMSGIDNRAFESNDKTKEKTSGELKIIFFMSSSSRIRRCDEDIADISYVLRSCNMFS